MLIALELHEGRLGNGGVEVLFKGVILWLIIGIVHLVVQRIRQIAPRLWIPILEVMVLFGSIIVLENTGITLVVLINWFKVLVSVVLIGILRVVVGRILV